MTLFNKKIQKWYIDVLVYIGLFVSGATSLYYVGNEFIESLFSVVDRSSASNASVLVLIAIITIYAYCFDEDRLQSIIFLFCAGVNFFALLLNGNVVSCWLMMFVFFVIPVMYRPTAELIKKDMQLLFLYAFMLCNMSLLGNYTSMVQKGMKYSLKMSVYLEMVFAIGALIFFHYWDRLPEGTDYSKISMVKLQRRYKTAICFLGVVMGSSLCIGNRWNELSDEGINTFVKYLGTTLNDELSQQPGMLFICLTRCGVIVTIGLGWVLFVVIKKMLRSYHQDKTVTNILIILSIVFSIELIVWRISVVGIIAYVTVLFLGVFIKEEKKEIVICYTRSTEDEEGNEQNCKDDFNSITVVLSDDVATVCE